MAAELHKLDGDDETDDSTRNNSGVAYLDWVTFKWSTLVLIQDAEVVAFGPRTEAKGPWFAGQNRLDVWVVTSHLLSGAGGRTFTRSEWLRRVWTRVNPEIFGDRGGTRKRRPHKLRRRYRGVGGIRQARTLMRRSLDVGEHLGKA